MNRHNHSYIAGIEQTHIVVMLIILLAILPIASLTLAQSDDDDDTDETGLMCDEAALIQQQAELQAMLDDFSTLLDDNSSEALATLYETGVTYQNLALDCGYIPDNAGELTVGVEIERILNVLETINGDPLNGQLLYNNEVNAADGAPLGCVGCHMVEEVAPLTEGTWTRWDEIRSLEPQFADYTFEEYIIESIVHPWDYTVPDYPEGTMPNTYGERLSYQNLADIIAYLFSQDQFID